MTVNVRMLIAEYAEVQTEFLLTAMESYYHCLGLSCTVRLSFLPRNSRKRK